MALENQRSRALFDRALGTLPGGVSSPVRAFKAVGSSPLFIDRAAGCSFWDADGNEYTDFVLSWGPLILGHAHPEVVTSVREAAGKGLTYGAPHENEVRLAERITGTYPGIERVRFTSSGTEATMSALRLARGYTGRDRIVKFSGCYHGHGDALLVSAGSGAVTLGVPSSAGVPEQFAELTTVLPLDDTDAFETLMSEQGNQIAAVIIEPIPANNGLLLQRREFLERLSDLTRECGALLIFDEVISGFRVAMGGAAELYGLVPDLVTFGKVVGGGMPVGAFAGRAELFEVLAPDGPVYQAGTLSGNPVAMAAGLATLKILERDHVIEGLEKIGADFEEEVGDMLTRGSYPVRLVRLGSLFWFSFGDGPVPRRAEQISGSVAKPYARFHRACLERGVYLAPSAYEVGFLSSAHSPEVLTNTVETLSKAFAHTFARGTAG